MSTIPKHFITFGRTFAIAASFPETDEGEKEANAFMQAHPGMGVIGVENGRVLVVDVNDKGTPLKAPLTAPKTLFCPCCGAWTIGRQCPNQDTGHGLCEDCVDRTARNMSVEDHARTYGLRGVHFDLG